MPEADRLLAIAEAEDPSLLPEGCEILPEIAAQQAIARSPVGRLLLDLHAIARQGTAGDVPVPPERFEAVLRMNGLAGRVLELLPELYRIDSAWAEGIADIRERKAARKRGDA